MAGLKACATEGRGLATRCSAGGGWFPLQRIVAADRVEPQARDAAGLALEDDERLVDAEGVAAAVAESLRLRGRRAGAFHHQRSAFGGDRHRRQPAAPDAFERAG